MSRILAILCWSSLISLAVHTPSAAADREPRRLTILSAHLATYQTAADAMRLKLEASGYTYTVINLPHSSDADGQAAAIRDLLESEPTVIVATGKTATSIALRSIPDVPVVFMLVPNTADAPFLRADNPDRVRLAGVAGDVSPVAWLDSIAEVQPDCSDIGILYRASSAHVMSNFRRVAERRGIRITGIVAQKDDFPSAVDELTRQRCASVLMLPDPAIYNSPNVQHLILWGARSKKPVWAFSASVVRAGALYGQYLDNAEVGRQAAKIVERIFDGEAPEKIGVQYPAVVAKAINVRTADLIGVDVGGNILKPETTRFGEKP